MIGYKHGYGQNLKPAFNILTHQVLIDVLSKIGAAVDFAIHGSNLTLLNIPLAQNKNRAQ